MYRFLENELDEHCIPQELKIVAKEFEIKRILQFAKYIIMNHEFIDELYL